MLEEEEHSLEGLILVEVVVAVVAVIKVVAVATVVAVVVQAVVVVVAVVKIDVAGVVKISTEVDSASCNFWKKTQTLQDRTKII